MNRRGFLKGIGAAVAVIPVAGIAAFRWTAEVVRTRKLTSYHDILTATLRSRSKEIAANITSHNVLLRTLKEKGVVKPFQGGNRLL